MVYLHNWPVLEGTTYIFVVYGESYNNCILKHNPVQKRISVNKETTKDRFVFWFLELPEVDVCFFFMDKNQKHQRHGLSKALMDFYQVKDLEEVFLCPGFYGRPVNFSAVNYVVSPLKDTNTGMDPWWTLFGLMAGQESSTSMGRMKENEESWIAQ